MTGNQTAFLRSTVLFLPVLYLYFSSFRYLAHQLLGSGDLNYGLLIPVVFGYLLWERRVLLSSRISQPSFKGTCLLAAGLCLFWLGELGGEYYTQYVGFILLLGGIVGTTYGFRYVRNLFFPLIVLMTMFPLPFYVIQALTAKLQLLSSRLGVQLLRLFGYSVYREGNIIDLGFTKLQVVEACSGLRYALPLAVLALLMGHFARLPVWRRIVVFLSAAPIAVVANALRIAGTGFLSEIWGGKVAEGFFHDFEGVFIFMIALGLLLLETLILRSFLPPGVKRSPDSPGDPMRQTGLSADQRARNKAYAPFIAALFLLGLSCTAYSMVKFREKVPISRPFAEFPMHIGKWTGETAKLEPEFIKALDLTDYLLADYHDPEGNRINFYTAYYGSQRKGESIHSPATCLRGGGWIFGKTDPLKVKTKGLFGGSITVRSAVLYHPLGRELAIYWYQKGGRVLDNVFALKSFVFWDALTRQRTDGALVRLMTPIGTEEEVEDARRRLVGFIQEALPELAQFLPGENPKVRGASTLDLK